jgi:hypothetical protein
VFTCRHPDLPYLKHLGSLLSAEWPLGADIFQEPFAHHEHTFLLGKQYGTLDTIKLWSSHNGNSVSESLPNVDTVSRSFITSHISKSVCSDRGSRLYLTVPLKSVGSCGMMPRWDLRS